MMNRGCSPLVFRWIGCLLIGGMACLASGCGAGIVGFIIGIDELSDQEKNNADLPPVVTGVHFIDTGTPDRICVEFQISNEDEGRLGARVELVLIPL